MRPDLVLLDVMLPDMDGFEVHRRLTSTSTPRMPVVFLTARRDTDDRVRGLTIGADDYVVKPFSLEELMARVRAVLRRTRGDEPAGGAAGVRGPGARRGRAARCAAAAGSWS